MPKKLMFVVVTIWCGITLESQASSAECGCLGSLPPGDHVVLICPQGDGPTLAEAGAIITLTYTDFPGGRPLSGVGPARSPGGCNGGIVWFGADPTSDGLTDSNGQTTVSGALAGGGYDTEVRWLLGGMPLPFCWEQYVPLVLVSPDINADLVVGLSDLSLFAFGYHAPPKPYDPRFDFDGDGTVGLVDLVMFAGHYTHGY